MQTEGLVDAVIGRKVGQPIRSLLDPIRTEIARDGTNGGDYEETFATSNIIQRYNLWSFWKTCDFYMII